MKAKDILVLIILILILASGIFIVVYLFQQKMNPPIPTATVPPTAQPTISPEELTSVEPWFEHDPGKIALFFNYQPPNTDEDMLTLIEKFTAVILTGNNESSRDLIKQNGFSTPVIRYMILNEIMDPGSCDKKPYQNQAANQKGDFCWIDEEHPEWFMRNEKGVDFKVGFGRMMDPSQQGWRDFFLDRVTSYQKEYEWDGLFLDNVIVSLNVFDRLSGVERISNYDDPYEFINQEVLFLKQIRETFTAEFPGQPIVGNMIDTDYSSETSLNDYMRLLNYLNGVMIEDFAVDWNLRYKSAETWEKQMDLIERTHDAGRNVIAMIQSEGKLVIDRLTFGLASYFLVDQGLCGFRYYIEENGDDALGYYSFYSLDLGEPIGKRYKDGNRWRRDFKNGFVWVNPENHESAIINNVWEPAQ